MCDATPPSSTRTTSAAASARRRAPPALPRPQRRTFLSFVRNKRGQESKGKGQGAENRTQNRTTARSLLQTPQEPALVLPVRWSQVCSRSAARPAGLSAYGFALDARSRFRLLNAMVCNRTVAPSPISTDRAIVQSCNNNRVYPVQSQSHDRTILDRACNRTVARSHGRTVPRWEARRRRKVGNGITFFCYTLLNRPDRQAACCVPHSTLASWFQLSPQIWRGA